MKSDVIIIGAGAAGLMCALTAGKRGRKVLLLDHTSSVGNKIKISGGGRCNFTNLHTSVENYISQNPHFPISALKRYTPNDFIALVEKHGIKYHEKTLGQLFCDGSANQIIEMLLTECSQSGVAVSLNSKVNSVEKKGDEFQVIINDNTKITAKSLVIATGGKSIPKIGATGFGYSLAKQFGLNIIPPCPALVPLTLDRQELKNMNSLSGISLEVIAECNNFSFREGLLFTHRGLSGPAILQISSYWKEREHITINFAPDKDIFAEIKSLRTATPKQDIQNALNKFIPKRLAQYFCITFNYRGCLADLSNTYLHKIVDKISAFKILPQGTEGYRTAEATLGGVDTNELSSKTFEAKNVSGLYFIGEVVDVTGHLGGFNLQWAWSSGYACGQFV